MADKRHHWSPEKRAQVVTAYIALGNSELVEAITKVPAGTVRKWKTEDWWKELEGILREEEHFTLDSRLRKVVEKSLDLVMDRLDNGDFYFDQKTGKVERKPVNLRDVHKVSAETIDRRALLAKFSSKAMDKPSLEEHVKKLAEEFAKFTQTLKGVRDGTGLQEGVQNLPGQAGTDQESVPAEPSALGSGESSGS